MRTRSESVVIAVPFSATAYRHDWWIQRDFSLVVQFTFVVGAPKTLKLPWPFLVKVGLRVIPVAFLAAGNAAFFGPREIDAFGAFVGPVALPAVLGSGIW